MASQFFRNSRSRLLYTSFNSQWRSSKAQFHILPLPEKPSPSSSFLVNRRFFWTSTSESSSYSSGNSNNGNQGSRFWRNDFWKCIGACTTVLSTYSIYRSVKQRRLVGTLGYHNEILDDANKTNVLINDFKKEISVKIVNDMINGKGSCLINHNGESVTKDDFLGRWNLIYFGDTSSPDICPDELQKLALAIDEIKEKSGKEVVPVFISVDPERDSVERVREYVQKFHPNIIGLTGAVNVIKKAERVTYLMDPNMNFVKFLKIVDDDSLAAEVIQEIEQYRK